MTLKPLRLILLTLAVSLALFPQSAKKAAPKTAPTTKAPAKKATTKKATPKKATAKKSTARRKTPARQLTPDRERVREIQEALTDRGYPVEPTGAWGPQSVAALKQFQEDHDISNLSGRGKLDPLTLIALGLGPKREDMNSEAPETPEAPTPNQEGQNP